MKVLLSGIGKRNELVKLMRDEGELFGLDLIGCDANQYAPARIEVDRFQKVLRADDKSFLESYLRFLESLGEVACLTLIDPEIPILCQIQQSKDVRIFHPEKTVSLLCEDKYEFAKSANINNINAFETSLNPLVEFPYICKDRRGSAASGFSYFNSVEDTIAHSENARLIYQPFCNGKHFCVDAYVSYYTGELVDLCIKEVLNKSKGESYLLKSIISFDIVEFIESICRWLPLKGIVNFDIYQDCGNLKLMEINCRIGGNYPASHAFGCNLLHPLMYEISTHAPYAPKFTLYKDNQFIVKFFSFSEPVHCSVFS